MRDTKKWIHHYLSTDSLQRLSQKIAEIEATTQAEVVVTLQKRVRSQTSSSLVQLLFSAVSLIILLFAPFEHHWLYWIVVGVLLLAVSTPLLVRQCPPLHRLLSSQAFLEESVEILMDSIFYRKRLFSTLNRNCVLILVSFDERFLKIRTDVGAQGVLENSELSEMIQILAKNFQSLDYEKGIIESLEYAGQKLKLRIPAQLANPNEISDEIIIIDHL